MDDPQPRKGIEEGLGISIIQVSPFKENRMVLKGKCD